MESLESLIPIAVLAVGGLLAIIVMLKGATDPYGGLRLGPIFAVLVMTMMVFWVAQPGALKGMSGFVAKSVNGLVGEGEPSSESSHQPSSEASSTPSSSPSQESTPAPSGSSSPTPQAPESTTDWTSVWMIVGIIAVVLIVLVFAIWLAVTLIRHSQVKHREYVEKREQEKAAEAERQALLERIKTAWQETVEKQDSLDTEYLSYQKDLSLIAKYPLMTDLAVPLTKKAVRAMTVAQNKRPPEAPVEMSTVDEYRDAVTSFEIALRAAVANAKREGLKNFSEKEQKDLRQVQDLLRMAEDRGGNPNERRRAYEKAVSDLQSILGDIPQEAVFELESRAQEEGLTLALTV